MTIRAIRIWTYGATFCAFVALSAAAQAHSPVHSPAFLPLGEETAAPRGFVDMCAAGETQQLCTPMRPIQSDATMVTAAIIGAPAMGTRREDAAPIGQADAIVASVALPSIALPSITLCETTQWLGETGRLFTPSIAINALGEISAASTCSAAPVPSLTAYLALAETDMSAPAMPAPDAPIATAAAPTSLPANAADMLKRVNRYVNRRVVQQTDARMFGVDEIWRRSGVGKNARGDCEDVAIEKRLQLIAEGFPPDRLAFAVVYSSASGLHTVLIARTDEGDVVLDNRSPYVEKWSDVKYSWLSIQAMGDAMSWRRLDRAAA